MALARNQQAPPHALPAPLCTGCTMLLLLLARHAAACPQSRPCCLLVLDDAQQLMAAQDSPLAALLALREQVRHNARAASFERPACPQPFTLVIQLPQR